MTLPTSIIEFNFGGTWTDVTGYVRSFSTVRGSSRAEGPTIRYEAGHATIVLDNRDRRFDPTNLSGPYVASGATQVRPMAELRIRATWSTTTYSVWRGFVDSWGIGYNGPTDSTTTVTATDATKVLAALNPLALGTPVGAGEDTGARINRILDNAGWSPLLRNIATGNTVVQGTTMAQNAWTELLLTADTENGAVFVDASGNVSFLNRQAQINGSSVATFGDGAGELPYTDVQISYDDAQIFNRVRIARVGGTQQVQEDATSQSQYLIKTFDRTDLVMTTDAEANNWAAWALYQSKDAELRFSTVTIDPQADATNLYPQVLGREIGHRVTVNRRPPGGGTITRDGFIRGVRHDVSPDRWKTTWTLQSASKFAFFVLDSPTLGVLDSNALSY